MKPENLPDVTTPDGIRRYLALVAALTVRNAMEGTFHGGPDSVITDERMPEFNALVRNAIYTALYATDRAARSRPAREWVSIALMNLPDCWETPEIRPDLKEAFEADDNRWST